MLGETISHRSDPISLRCHTVIETRLTGNLFPVFWVPVPMALLFSTHQPQRRTRIFLRRIFSFKFYEFHIKIYSVCLHENLLQYRHKIYLRLASYNEPNKKFDPEVYINQSY